MFQYLRFIPAIAIVALLACSAQAGQSYEADQARWLELAVEACHRGDEPAYRALIERSATDGQCIEGTHEEITTSDGVD